MRFLASTSDSLALPYRYNGKELEAMNGLNQSDYGARRKYSWGSIWTTIDPHAENHYSWSPYAYCSDNPLNKTDPDGKDDYDLNFSVTIGCGAIGYKGKILGIPVEFYYDFGGVSQTIKGSISVDTDKKQITAGVSHTTTETKEGSGSVKIAKLGVGKSKEKSRTYELNTKDKKVTKTEDKSYQEKENVSAGPVKEENGKTSIDVVATEIKALLISLGAKLNLEITPSQPKKTEPNK
jgi:RHS repeat-associated protein